MSWKQRQWAQLLRRKAAWLALRLALILNLLERQQERELKLARQPALTVYGAESSRGNSSIRPVKIGVIESIVALGSELHAHAFGEGEVLDQREIPLGLAGGANG
jgi:hypothetical protein